MTSHLCLRKGISGFSLIELSAIVAISATLMVGYLNITQPKTLLKAEKIMQTKSSMDHVSIAIKRFKQRFGRMPCPADPWMRSDQTRSIDAPSIISLSPFGTESIGSNGTCIFQSGMVPIHSLGLEEKYALDKWNNRLRYHPSFSKLKITHNNGTIISNNASYILLSHGPNGLGAFMASGIQRDSSNNPQEENNATSSGTYIDHAGDDILLSGHI